MKLNYTLAARTYPVMIVLIPLVITGSYFSFSLNTNYLFYTSIGIYGALSYLLTHIGRDFGKKKESKLWKMWGGMPTIQILRYTNNHLDSRTKKRYHAKLNILCPVGQIPTKEIETSNPDEMDDIYSTWTKYMIANTRDTAKYKLLFKENVSYGFRRNLWGLKRIALFIIVIVMTILSLTNYYRQGIHSFTQWPKEYFISLGFLISLLIFWITIVNKDWIKRVAYSYAERLFEATEKINLP